jgi:long-subunit acyl-CoA synthetase (AMP-forming)/acyl carrier protein
MKNPTIAGFSRINDYVKDKLRRFESMEPGFASLFELMFSERDNVLYEVSEGYRIVRTTYGEAREAAIGKSAALSRMLADVPRGAVVGIYLENGPEWIETLWAVLRSGFRPLLMNMRLDDETLREALREADAAAVISESREFGVRAIHGLPPEEADGGETEFAEELLVMSSGTSGGVKLCAYGAEEFRLQIRDSLDIILKCKAMKKLCNGQIKHLDFLPFYHIFGLTAVYVWFGFFARTFVHLNDLAPQTIVNTIRRHEVTHIFSVPLFWEKVREQALCVIDERGKRAKFERALALSLKISGVPLLGPLFAKLAFREVRDNLFGESISFMITGGSAIPARVLEFFNGIGYRLANGYGMTETGITSVELSDSVRVRCTGSVGRPMSSITYSRGPDGGLRVSGTSTAKYIIEGGARREREAVFDTRDLAEEKGGRWYILGRRDDLVVSPGGENLNPEIIEQRFDIDGLDGVCLVADRRGGESVPVLLAGIGRGYSPAKAEKLGSAVRGRIGELGLAPEIKSVVLVADRLIGPDEFKLNRRRLAAALESGSLPVFDPSEEVEAPDDPLCAEILGMFAAALGREPGSVSYKADFFLDLGGSSLDYFAMIAALRERFGIDFPTEAGSSLGSAEALYEYVKAKI